MHQCTIPNMLTLLLLQVSCLYSCLIIKIFTPIVNVYCNMLVTHNSTTDEESGTPSKWDENEKTISWKNSYPIQVTNK